MRSAFLEFGGVGSKKGVDKLFDFLVGEGSQMMDYKKCRRGSANFVFLNQDSVQRSQHFS